MGKFYDEIPQSHFAWIKKQNIFFVATAPLDGHGHINVSPKGTADCFHVVNSKQVWYEDITGSGNVHLVCSQSTLTDSKHDDGRYRDHFACSGEWPDNDHALCFRRCP